MLTVLSLRPVHFSAPRAPHNGPRNLEKERACDPVKGVYFSPKKNLDELYRHCWTEYKHRKQELSLTVVIDYKALNYDDVSVSAQEVVTSSEESDESDWVWVRKQTGQEGYIPRACTVNLGLLNLDPHTRTTYL